MKLCYTPEQMYRKWAAFSDEKERDRYLTILSELTCMTQRDLLALIKKEQARVRAEDSKKEKILEVMSELVCDLANVQEILGYLRYLGLNDDKSTFYYWRVKDDMRAGKFVLNDENTKIIVDAILANERPAFCYESHDFGCSKKEFQSIWYRLKNEMKKTSDVPEPNMEMLDKEFLADIRERMANGEDKESCFSKLKPYLTRRRFDMLWGKAVSKPDKSDEESGRGLKKSKGEKPVKELGSSLKESETGKPVKESGGGSKKSEGEKPVRPKKKPADSAELKIEEHEDSIELRVEKPVKESQELKAPPLAGPKTPVSMNYVVIKLKAIYNILGELIEELEVDVKK